MLRQSAGVSEACVTATVPQACEGLRFDQALARMFPQYSRSRLQAWVRAGYVQLEGVVPALRAPVAGGERVVLHVPEFTDASAPAAQPLPLAIVHEDADLLVLDKPAGLVVHPGAGVPDRTLLNALLAHAPALAGIPRAGIVHRLDRDTSGLLVVAKTLQAHAGLVRQLADRTVTRSYAAVVHGRPAPEGTVDAPVGRDPRSRTRMAVVQRGRPARTHFRLLEVFALAALLECRLDTGRTHQIRVHLQHLGHPIVGDPVYARGARPDPAFSRQALHARALSLVHPRSGDRMQWRAALPADMRALLRRLRADT